MANLILQNINLGYDKIERVVVSHSGSNVAGVKGGDGRSGNWSGHIVLGEF